MPSKSSIHLCDSPSRLLKAESLDDNDGASLSCAPFLPVQYTGCDFGYDARVIGAIKLRALRAETSHTSICIMCVAWGSSNILHVQARQTAVHAAKKGRAHSRKNVIMHIVNGFSDVHCSGCWMQGQRPLQANAIFTTLAQFKQWKEERKGRGCNVIRQMFAFRQILGSWYWSPPEYKHSLANPQGGQRINSSWYLFHTESDKNGP